MPAIVAFIVEKLFHPLLKDCDPPAGESTAEDAPIRTSVRAGHTTATLGPRVQGLLLALVIGIALLGCQRKQVYIPPEYRSPPAPPSYGAPQPGAPPIQQTPPVSKSPELKSREEAAVSAPAPAPAVQKQFEPFEPQPAPVPAKKKQQERPKDQEAAKSPQRQASMQQVSQARGQLERGKPDAAIRTLEQAIRIDAGNGEAFILLARAWKQKGEKRKALEFAKKAELLYQKQPARLKDVYLFESELYRELGDSAKNGHKLRQKAQGAPQKPPE
jgi:type IV secretory pathway VirB10-like protein